jgi:predicted SAM-dependent methyltransferase
VTQPNNRFTQLLNVGCGRCYHDDWTNIDLVASGPQVRQHDLRRGLPYDNGRFDAVYHSHVLEHLTPEDAATLLAECGRVLRPGGVLRVAVPDLEGIAKAYLGAIEAAQGGDPYAIANHRWMTLELIDQMTRQQGGGRMGAAMRDRRLLNHDFIRARIGGEVGEHRCSGVKKTIQQRVMRMVADFRKTLALTAVSLIDGKSGRIAYREGRFRQSGEIHRWMYDRISLAQLMVEVGFEDPTVCRADESRIDRFDSYQLDRGGNVARKPDSLYMESVKPAVAVRSIVSPSKAA